MEVIRDVDDCGRLWEGLCLWVGGCAFGGFDGCGRGFNCGLESRCHVSGVSNQFPGACSCGRIAWGCGGCSVVDLNCVAGGGGCVVVGCVAAVSVDAAFPEPSGLAAGSACKDFFSWASILSRQSRIDLSKTSLMATARCGFSPKGESLMMSRSEERSIEGLKSEWKSSCCISMMGL